METEERPGPRERSRDTRSRFDRFVEVAQGIVSRPEAFAVAVAIIVLWGLSFPLFHEIAEWHAVIHSAASITSLLLLVLLENAGRRADQSAQEKLNVLSEALMVLLEDRADERGSGSGRETLLDQAKMLRTTIGLEERE